MPVTKLSTKQARDKKKSAQRQATLKRLCFSPPLRKVDVEGLIAASASSSASSKKAKKGKTALASDEKPVEPSSPSPSPKK